MDSDQSIVKFISGFHLLGLSGSSLLCGGLFGSGLLDCGLFGSGLLGCRLFGGGLLGCGLFGGGFLGSGLLGCGLFGSGSRLLLGRLKLSKWNIALSGNNKMRNTLTK